MRTGVEKRAVPGRESGATRSPMGGIVGLICLVVAVLAGASTSLAAPPGFAKSFDPDTIGPGSISTLSFTIANTDPGPVTELAFTDVLPAGMTIATPAAVTDSCDGSVTAPDGGGTITFADGRVAGFSACTITVNVTSSTVGTSTNTTGDLTSDAGNSGTASDDLTVDSARPGFAKSFSPSAVVIGYRSTLTFTIDNTANSLLALNPTFTDALPIGLEVADPANVAVGGGCNGSIVTATSGLSTISMSGGFLAASSSCSVSVDVIATGTGLLGNTTGDLTTIIQGQLRSSGKAGATIDVTVDDLALTKSFTDDPTSPGDDVTLSFTITNRNRSEDATDITFTDDLTATLSGLVAVGLPASNVCGAGSLLSGTTLLTLTGGSVAAGESCTFDVTLQVPATATTGAYPNVTSDITGTVAGSPVAGSPGAETLFIVAGTKLTKTFLDNPVGAGGTTTIEFTITNAAAGESAGDIAFTDNLDFIVAAMATSLPANGFCGAGSTLFQQFIADQWILTMAGGSLAPGASCTFTVDMLVPVGTGAGDYTNTTSEVTANYDGEQRVGKTASDVLSVVAGANLQKSFIDDPTQPGGTVTLEFELSHDETAAADATAISFTDDLSFLSGLTATGLPVSNICGAGSTLSGTTSLSFTGGTLVPGASCTFTVVLQVPVSALPGTHTNTTSEVTSTVSGVTTSNSAARDDLAIDGLTFAKSFTDDPAIPGGTVTLEFTIANTAATASAASIFFSDDLNAVLSGLTATTTPLTDPCGTGSTLAGTSSLVLIGGNLTAGASCTFAVTLQVPVGAVAGSYTNTTSSLTATFDNQPVSIDPATDALEISSDLLLFSKEFTDDPVAPGDNVSLEFTITNQSPSQSVTSIAFTDDLDAVLSGLAAVGLPANDVCGVGSQLTGTGVLTLSGGVLAPGASCTFVVSLLVPATTPLGSVGSNTTSELTGTAGGLEVTGDPAVDLVEVLSVDLDVPAPLTLECNSPGGVAATDAAVVAWLAQAMATTSCDSVVTINNDAGTLFPSACAPGQETVVTFTAEDECGNRISDTSTITVRDTTAPTLVGVPANATVECSAIPAAATVTATDNCDPTLDVVFDEVRVGDDCTGTITRTWTVVDDCGLETTATQVLQVEDTTDPVVVGAPADATVECSAIPTPPTVTATDNCDTTVAVVFDETRVGDDCTGTITRTWTATDDCGNDTVATQVLQLEDATDPVLAGVPADATVECSAIPPAATPTASDNCDTDVAIVLDEVRVGDDCTGTITRTWTATDDCGNAATGVQVLQLEDSTDPVLAGVPADATVECSAIPPAATPTASDNCDTDVTIVLDEVRVGDDCTGTITRTWTATDDCGNTATGVQVLQLEDSTDPVLTGVPGPVTVECDAVPPPATPGATDNCDPAPTVTFATSSTQTADGSCTDFSYTITHTWTATDACGNTTSASQVVTVQDSTAPTIADVPDDVTIECDEMPTTATPTASDNCDGAPTLVLDETPGPAGRCPDSSSLVRTWTATDACGNESTATQTITFDDTTAPLVTALLEPVIPLPPVPANSAASVCSPATQRLFRVVCEADDNCDPMPVVSAQIVAEQSVVGAGGTCSTLIEEIAIGCGDEVEIQLLATPCPAQGPTSAHSATSVNSAGVLIVFGDVVRLEVTAEDQCGNVGGAEFDPAAEPSVLCDEELSDGTCCPAIAQPEGDACEGGDCRAGLVGRDEPASRHAAPSSPESAESGRRR